MTEEKTTKMNIGLSISRNYDKVTLEMIDEPIVFDNEEELKAKIRRILGVLREEIDLEFTKIQGK